MVTGRKVNVVAACLVGAALAAACGGEGGGLDGGGRQGRIRGQVVVSGPLRGAQVAVDQLRLDGDVGSVRAHVGDATTDAEGRFAVDVGTYNGVLRLTARGGAFTDLASGATVELDASASLESLAIVGLYEDRDDVLVSPVGHLIAARTAFELATRHDLMAAEAAAATHLNLHFGNVDWTRLVLPTLDEPAPSPTEGVRAALVQAGLSLLAQDLAQAAGTTAQEVNAYALTRQWATDLSSAVFDGDDANAPAWRSGLQLGDCPAVPTPCGPGASGCQLGACRTLCDLYANTPRALLAGAMAKALRAPFNRTGLTVTDALAIVRAVADDPDVTLFGDACLEDLDRLAPSLVWSTATPAPGAYVRGAVTAQVTAVDDLDPAPVAALVGLADADGDPTNAVALAVLDTTALGDGALALTATARDQAGNVATAIRSLVVDNTAPAVALTPAGVHVDAATGDWWTAVRTPTLAGTVVDASPVTVRVTFGGSAVDAVVTGGSFVADLGAAPLPGAVTDVTVTATDAAGNATSVVRRLRWDATPPSLEVAASAVRDEAGDVVTFATDPNGNALVPSHVHAGAAIDLSVAGACPTVTKHSYLLDEVGSRWVSEDAPNHLRYLLTAADDGVGLDPAGAAFRVRRRDAGGGSAVVLDWTSLGPGATAGSAVQHVASLYRAGLAGTPLVPGLAEADATYDVDVRVADLLGRPTTVTRCVALKVVPPPLVWGTAAPASGHAYALRGLTIGGGLAARLLNDDASGASILDLPVTNGAGETVYLDVATPLTQGFVVGRSFATDNTYASSAPISATYCCDPRCGAVPAKCTPSGPVYAATSTGVPDATVKMTVRVFTTSAPNTPVTEVPCLNCTGTPPQPPAGQGFRFALAGRAGIGVRVAPKSYLVMTMMHKSLPLRPSDATSPAVVPFADFALAGVGLSGKQGAGAVGCTGRTLLGPTSLSYCAAEGTVVPYRTLTSVTIANAAQIKVDYGAAQTASAATVVVKSGAQNGATLLTTTLGALPPRP